MGSFKTIFARYSLISKVNFKSRNKDEGIHKAKEMNFIFCYKCMKTNSSRTDSFYILINHICMVKFFTSKWAFQPRLKLDLPPGG